MVGGWGQKSWGRGVESGGWGRRSWDQGVEIGGLESGKLGSGGLGLAELWLEDGVRASGEVGSRRLELGGGWGRGG